MVASLITRGEAAHFDASADHLAKVSLAHEVMLLVVGCVVMVLALVVLAAAGAYCCWRRCCRDTATRECPGSLPKCEGVSENAIVTDFACSARRRDELRVALWRGHGAWALTGETAAAVFVRRRLGSRPGGLALTDDAGAVGWIVEVCKEKSVHNDGRGRTRT